MSAPHGLSCDCGQRFHTVTGLRYHLNEHAPETLYTVIDTTAPEGQSIADSCEKSSGVLYQVLEFNANRECEFCYEEGAYHVLHDDYGAATCRYHLEKEPAVAAVVESKDEVRQFTTAEATMEEDDS